LYIFVEVIYPDQELKNQTIDRTLDDIAFEGRNKEYGAYFIRKRYDTYLGYSLVIAISTVLLILFVIVKYSGLKRTDYYLNPSQGGHSVALDLSDKPYGLKTMKSAAKPPSSSDFILPKIVANIPEESASAKDKNTKTEGSKDTIAAGNSDSNRIDSASMSGSGDGIVGEVYGSADINPQFPGGDKAMQEFIRENLHYPEIARIQNISGIIHVYLVIQSNGYIRDVKVIRGLQADLDNEAIRVVKAMPVWKPGTRRNVPVNVRCIIPITVSPQKYNK
jgi:periplasmic protein TonB